MLSIEEKQINHCSQLLSPWRVRGAVCNLKASWPACALTSLFMHLTCLCPHLTVHASNRCNSVPDISLQADAACLNRWTHFRKVKKAWLLFENVTSVRFKCLYIWGWKHVALQLWEILNSAHVWQLVKSMELNSSKPTKKLNIFNHIAFCY